MVVLMVQAIQERKRVSKREMKNVYTAAVAVVAATRRICSGNNRSNDCHKEARFTFVYIDFENLSNRA